MVDTYFTDITHYLDEQGNLVKDMPGPARKLASFLVLIVDTISPNCSDVFIDTEFPCRKKGCFGKILAQFDPESENILWHCTNCTHNGVISNWQNTKWDQRGVK